MFNPLLPSLNWIIVMGLSNISLFYGILIYELVFLIIMPGSLLVGTKHLSKKHNLYPKIVRYLFNFASGLLIFLVVTYSLEKVIFPLNHIEYIYPKNELLAKMKLLLGAVLLTIYSPGFMIIEASIRLEEITWVTRLLSGLIFVYIAGLIILGKDNIWLLIAGLLSLLPFGLTLIWWLFLVYAEAYNYRL